VKATSRAHDKQVALNTNRNFNTLQSSKPWAVADDNSNFGRGRGASIRGRGASNRGGRPGNESFPRNNNNFSSGGQGYSGQPRTNTAGKSNFNQQSGRGQRGGPQQQGYQRPNPNANNNNPNQGHPGGNFNNGGYPSKPRPPNRGFRGGGH
jgi:hypothetical protein